MNELLLLLLPVAAASGWWAATRSLRKRPDPRCNQPDPGYFKGINYLLNEQPDKAIDVFIQMLEVDSDTVETHLALGSLFRRRGEVDRAIRIHQNLIARPTLDRDQRAQALLELGRDYMRAGLFDRAENLFQELVEINLHQVPALENLRVVYQQEKDWHKALDVLAKLESATRESHGEERAHYYCELAEAARRAGDHSGCMDFLRRALAADRRSLRATLLQAELEFERGDFRDAIRLFQRAEELDPEYLPEILPPLVECYKRLGNRRELMNFLQGLQEQRGGLEVVLVLTDLMQQEQGTQAAQEFLVNALQRNPSLRGLRRLARLQAGQQEGDEFSDLLAHALDQLLEHRPAYRCQRCGYTAKTLHWQCPGCRAWGTTKPVSGEEAG